MQLVPGAYESSVAIVGTVTLDILHILKSNYNEQLQMSFGGVCKNVACTLGSLGIKPLFISVKFSGEVGGTITEYFSDNNVEWIPFSCAASMPLFQATIDLSGNVINESFVEYIVNKYNNEVYCEFDADVSGLLKLYIDKFGNDLPRMYKEIKHDLNKRKIVVSSGGSEKVAAINRCLEVDNFIDVFITDSDTALDLLHYAT